MKLNRIFIILLMLVACAPSAKAQQFTATVDRKNVSLGDVVEVTYKLTGTQGQDMVLPALDGLRILSGPAQTSQLSINGTVTSVAVSYTYAMQTIKKGNLTLGPASITVRGKKLYSNALNITVTGNKPSASGSQKGESFFMRAIADKTQALQGEAVTVLYKLYVADNVDMQNPTTTKMPTFTGFWSETGTLPQQMQKSREKYNGRDYDVYIDRKLILFAQRSGQLTVDPLEIECTGQMHQGGGVIDPTDPFDIFGNIGGGGSIVPFHKNVVSNSIKINILPLPDKDRPASFTGMVGRAAISTTIASNTVKANEPVTYRITIGGEGNLSLQQPLKLHLPADIEVYDPKTVDKIDRTGNNLTGTRTFEYTLMPHKEGKYEIPAVAFSYFDPIKKKYNESKTAPIILDVEKNDKPAVSADNTGSKNKTTTEIDYVKWGIVAGMGALLLFAGLLFLRRKPEEDSGIDTHVPVPVFEETVRDTDYMKHMAEATRLAGNDEHNTFYTVLLNALYSYMEQFLQIPFAQISHETIRTGLQQKNIPEELIKRYLSIIDTCEMIKFAPPGMAADKSDLLQKTKELIGEIG